MGWDLVLAHGNKGGAIWALPPHLTSLTQHTNTRPRTTPPSDASPKSWRPQTWSGGADVRFAAIGTVLTLGPFCRGTLEHWNTQDPSNSTSPSTSPSTRTVNLSERCWKHGLCKKNASNAPDTTALEHSGATDTQLPAVIGGGREGEGPT